MGPPKRTEPPRQAAPGNARANGVSTVDYSKPRRLPPFGKAIIEGRRNGQRWRGTGADGSNHTAWILVGSEAWSVGKRWQAGSRLVTLCPPDEDPRGYRWDCLAGIDPVLLRRCGDADGEQVQSLIRAMLADGVKSVIEVPSLTMHTKGGSQ